MCGNFSQHNLGENLSGFAPLLVNHSLAMKSGVDLHLRANLKDHEAKTSDNLGPFIFDP